MTDVPAPSGSSPDAARARCRHCGARLREDAEWCPLCHTAVSGTPAAETPAATAAGPLVPAARTGEQDGAPAADAPPPRKRSGRRETKEQAKSRAQARARARAKGLIAAPVLPAADDVEDDAADDAPVRPELTDERIDELLAKLAASETSPDPVAMLGPLGRLHGRAGGLLLPVVLGSGLLVAALVVAGVLAFII